MKALFTSTADGTAFDIQPAGVLILLASEVRENPGSHKKGGRIQGHIDAILSAARAGGCTQRDILATLLAQGEMSHRVKAMATEACAAAGNEAIGQIFAAMRTRQENRRLENEFWLAIDRLAEITGRTWSEWVATELTGKPVGTGAASWLRVRCLIHSTHGASTW